MSAPAPVAEWPWVDLLGLLFLVVFAFLGLLRGLWWQVVRLVGVLFAVLVARGLSDALASVFRGALEGVDARVAHGLAWLLLFCATLALVAWIGQLGKGALEMLQLDLVDRFGGMLAGLVTGLLCFCAFLIALGLLAPQHWLLDHVPGTRSARLIDLCARQVPLVLGAERGQQLVESLERRTSELAFDGGVAAPRPPSTDARAAAPSPSSAPTQSSDASTQSSGAPGDPPR